MTATSTLCTEQNVRMTAQLYQARDTARQVLGDRFSTLMASLGADLTRRAEATGRQPLSIAIQAARSVSGMDAVILLAAAVELAEPSQEATAA